MRHKIGFIAIGGTLKYHGREYIAVADGKHFSCEPCVFKSDDECPCTLSLTECSFRARKDGTSIYFKDKED